MSPQVDPFVQHFRASAPYIHAHRGRTFVIMFGGEAVESRDLRTLLYDVALLHSLGVRIVLVVGARPQIDEALARRGEEPRYARGLRITDEVALQCVKEAVGTTRVELESLLSMGLPNSPMAGARLRVATGNFVIAQPVGVVDGIDYQYTGKPRRIDAEAIVQRLDDGAIVVLTPIGYSATGEAFNISSHDVAAATAVALRADKLIGLLEEPGVLDAEGKTPTQLTPREAEAILASGRDLGHDVERHLAAAIEACRGGVPRAHLVARQSDGSLLRELFTRDGIGTLVTSETFEGVRLATRDDIGGILALIEPLEEQGILVRRSREMLENDIDRFTVIERDGMVIACAALYPYPKDAIAELACLVVHPDYRTSGRGDQLLQYLERESLAEGLTRMFVLTTQTSHWFRERGFESCALDELPKARRSVYDQARRSKVLLKTLG
ncbi:MAG: N-acetylglutamate synthase [Myxococcales bacterium SG8_38]|nr:MAG: N-acetylglutamate synthase [Myxococcales bacterium SG8_38]